MNVLRRESLGRILDGIEGRLDALSEVIEEEEAEDALAELLDAWESMTYCIENLRERFNIEF